MTFNIDGRTIDIPDVVAKDYKDTMKLDLDEDTLYIYSETSRSRGGVPGDVKGIIDEIYREISRYDTFTGRHRE